MIRHPLISGLILCGLAACSPSYSPDTYASNAAQQANKVEQGLIVGVRPVAISAAGTVGSVTGAAAGGIAGSQVASGPVSAFTALGGSLLGGIGGSAVEHATADTIGFEYIVRKSNGDLISVTQKDKTPLEKGQKVLVIAGTQARIVPDYTDPPPDKTAGKEVAKAAEAETAKAPEPPKPVETPVAADPKPAEPPAAAEEKAPPSP